MWRVAGSRLRRSSTARPEWSGRPTSSRMPLGFRSLRQRERLGRGRRDHAVEVELVREVDQDRARSAGRPRPRGSGGRRAAARRCGRWRGRRVGRAPGVRDRCAVAGRCMAGCRGRCGHRDGTRRGRRRAGIVNAGHCGRRRRRRRRGATPAPSSAGSAVTSSSRGRISVNMLPRPGSLSTVMSPPSRRASSREIDSPRPVPPKRRLVLPSAWRNASKITSCCAAGCRCRCRARRSAPPRRPRARPAARPRRCR